LIFLHVCPHCGWSKLLGGSDAKTGATFSDIAWLHRVQVAGGSNPLAPTKEIKALQASLVRPFSFPGRLWFWAASSTSRNAARRKRPSLMESFASMTFFDH
jgi:hypothetical protein